MMEYHSSMRPSLPDDTPTRATTVNYAQDQQEDDDLEYVLEKVRQPNNYLAHFLQAAASLDAISSTGGHFYAYDIHGNIQACHVPPSFTYTSLDGHKIEVHPALYYRTMRETAGLEPSSYNTKIDTSFPQGRHCLFWVTGLEREVDDAAHVCCGAPSINKQVRARTGKEQTDLTKSDLKRTLVSRLHAHKTNLHYVSKVLCVNLGDFTKSASAYASMNHLIALMVFNEISAIQLDRKKTVVEIKLRKGVPRMQLFAVDDEYCPATKKMLESWGFEILSSAEGYKQVDSSTFVISFNSTSREPVCQIVSGLLAAYGGPAGMLCNTIDESDGGFLESLYADNCKIMDVGSLLMARMEEDDARHKVNLMGNVRLYLRADDGDAGEVEQPGKMAGRPVDATFEQGGSMKPERDKVTVKSGKGAPIAFNLGIGASKAEKRVSFAGGSGRWLDDPF